jgi:hypothetical protein
MVPQKSLIELKNPSRATFIKQQNNAITQQVNNGVKSNPKNHEKVANKLLEIKYEQRMDTRTTTSTIPVDPAMTSVDVCRSKNSRRKSN